MIVTTDQLFQIAYGNFALGAYNINNMEQCIGLFQGNLDSQAPFIIQISRSGRKYARIKMLEGLIRSAEEVFPEAIFAVHLDHGDEETAYDCIDSGFYSSVMIDASHHELKENIAITKRVVDRALQVHGGLGMTDDTIIAHFYRHERASRIYDGVDEVHKVSVARQILKPYANKPVK